MQKNKYQKNLLNLLIKLVYLIDLKDSYTKKHSDNVAKYAVLLSEKLGFGESDIKTIEIAAKLHDVGKIGLPDYLLTKKERLTEKEYEIIKRHVLIGELLVPVEGFEKIRQIVRSHHERLDGKGYPDGLKNDEIPYIVRIISVVDTFDAITTQRSYNKIKTLDEAFEELTRASKKNYISENEYIQQLDPYIVETFIKMIKSNKSLMEEFQERDSNIINDRNKVKKRE